MTRPREMAARATAVAAPIFGRSAPSRAVVASGPPAFPPKSGVWGGRLGCVTPLQLVGDALEGVRVGAGG